jgi:hypothetical protein
MINFLAVYYGSLFPNVHFLGLIGEGKLEFGDRSLTLNILFHI